MTRPEPTPDLVSGAHRMLGDLERVASAFADDPARVQELAFAPLPAGAEPRAIIGPRAGPGTDTEAMLRAQLEAGASAVEELARSGPGAKLTEDQELGLDVMLHFTARPALFLEDWSFTDPAPPWGVLIDAAEQIAETGQRVGRVDTGRPPHAGTGFLVADGVLMTNCHVARRIADADAGWALRPDVVPTVCFAPDPDLPGAAAVPVEGVIGVHDRCDFALLRLRGDGLPTPLELASAAPEPLAGHSAYVVGYPARNPRQQEPMIARLVFGERYGVKRLQPGAVLEPGVGPPLSEQPCSHRTTEADVFHHDASTLGGNSGSCVADLGTHRVLGIHFAGAHRRYNDAVALWKLADDPLLTAAGVRFAQG